MRGEKSHAEGKKSTKDQTLSCGDQPRGGRALWVHLATLHTPRGEAVPVPQGYLAHKAHFSLLVRTLQTKEYSNFKHIKACMSTKWKSLLLFDNIRDTGLK